MTTDIVLIEDNANDAELLLLAVRKAGLSLNIKTLRDGAEALAYLTPDGTALTRTPIRLVLLDLKLPKLNGFQVLEELRGHASFEQVPIVVFTSSAVESDILKAYKLGANSYIVKPIDYVEHSKTVTQTIRYWTEINVIN